MQNMNLLITAAGVIVALFIGGMQIYIAKQQKEIAAQQTKVSALQGEMQVVSSWLPFLKDADSNIRYMAVIALERLGTESTVAPLVTALSDDEESVRNRAAAALGRIATRDVIDIVAQVLENQNPKVRDAAVQALVQIGYEHIDQIQASLAKVSPSARKYSEQVIERILLNEYALNKIGALESQQLVAAQISESLSWVQALIGPSRKLQKLRWMNTITSRIRTSRVHLPPWQHVLS